MIKGGLKSNRSLDFLHRRASGLIDEARHLAHHGPEPEACQRLLATCAFLEESFGRGHQQLPELLDLLAGLYESLGEFTKAASFAALAAELNIARSDQIARLLDESCLPDPEQGANWPPSAVADGLVGQFEKGSISEVPREILLWGGKASAKTALACHLGRAAVRSLIPVRFFLGFELLERLERAKIDHGLAPELLALDRFEILVVDEIDPWTLSGDDSEILHNLLLHRRNSQVSILILAPGPATESAATLSELHRTRGLRSLGLRALVIHVGR